MSPQFQLAISIWRIFWVAKATEFYCDYLSFWVDFEARRAREVYMQVCHRKLILHLSEHHGDASPGSTAFVPITNIKAYHAELGAKK
jgi:Glyoxalase superfamily protein